MSIGIDASRANKEKRTGVEWYSYFLIQEFKRIVPADTQVILYSPTPLRDDLLPLPQNWEVRILRWPFARFWTIFRFSWEMLWRKPDALFVPSHIIPFFSPKRTFTTIHDIGFKRFPECYSWLGRCLQNFGTKRALHKAKKILTPSQFTKQELIKIYNAPEQKIIPIPHGCNTKLCAINADMVLDKYKIKKPYLFYIGRLEKKKNIENILKAVKGLNILLVLAGKKGLEFPNYQLQITNYQYLGWVNDKDAQMLMNEAEILLYPSLYEGFGFPILDAFSLGVPVITSNCASMPEVAGDAALLVNPKNPQEITEAIKKILTNPELKNNLISKGKERAKQFSWQTCAQKTWNEIKGIKPFCSSSARK